MAGLGFADSGVEEVVGGLDLRLRLMLKGVFVGWAEGKLGSEGG